MKGLLLKDMYVMGRELKIFGLMIFVFALIPQMYTQIFAVVYSSMLPITAIAYDEQAKWNHLASMMPYRKKDMITSKYLIGIVTSTTATALAVLAQFVAATVKGDEFSVDSAFFYLMILGAAFLLLSINLPLVFKLGPEKGRMAYLLVTVAMAVAIGVSTEFIGKMQTLSPWVLSLGALAIGIVVMLISVQVSIGIYQRKEF